MTDRDIYRDAIVKLRQAERRDAMAELNPPHFLVYLVVAILMFAAVGAAMVAAWAS